MKQKTFLDLTPLLDVVLILLFAFMLNVNAAGTEKDTQLQSKEEINKELQHIIQNKEDQISDLQNDLSKLKDTTLQLNKQIDEMSFDRANESETLDTIAKNLAKWFDDNQYKLEQIASDQNIDQLVDKNSLLEQLHKYEVLSKKYFFIDVKLKSTDNKLFINGKDTNTYISLEEVLTAEDRNNKKEQIKDIIDKEIDDREGGYTFILITLSEEDHVYRYAFTLVWDAIKGIEQKHGTDKIFKTKYVPPR